MPALAVNLSDYHEPSVEEIDAARLAARRLSKAGDRDSVSLVLESEKGGAEPITVPANIFRSILKLLVEIGNGNAVQVLPVEAELTTQQAADLLNVSRPHLIKLLEQEQMPFRMVGTHRKLAARDVLAYRDRIDHARREALARMVSLDEEAGLYETDEALAADSAVDGKPRRKASRRGLIAKFARRAA